MANALNKVKTSGVEDDAISLAKMAPGTDGQVITYDASGNPVAVGPGTDGQVLTSTGAGSPPAFETLPTSGATLSGSTNNTIVTVTGANAMQGEADLTFDGTTLDFGVTSTGDENIYLRHNSNSLIGLGVASNYGLKVFAPHDGTAGNNMFETGTTDGSSFTQKGLAVTFGGDVKVGTGNLVIGTSGKGIDFSATSDGTTMSSELFDDYEEGTYTPTFTSSGGGTPTVGGVTGWYVKVGRMVHAMYRIRINSMSGMSGEYRLSIPFTSDNGGSGDHLGTHIAFEDWAIESDEQCVGIIDDNQTYIRLIKLQHIASWGNMVPDNAPSVYGCATYMTD